MKATFEELFNIYSKKVYNLALRFTGSNEDAEDIVQNTFLQIYMHLDDFREESAVYTWIYKIALNNCLQHKKNTKMIVQPIEEELSSAESISGESDKWFNHPEKSSVTIELLMEIRQFCYQFLIIKLPENQRIAYILRHILELSYKDIAEITGTSESVIKARLYRAKSSLTRLIEKKKHTCSWYNENADSCCKRKIGYLVQIDDQLLKRTKHQAYEAGLISNDEIKSAASDIIGKMFEQFPVLAHKVDINSIKNQKIM